jgi:hypothetical protein
VAVFCGDRGAIAARICPGFLGETPKMSGGESELEKMLAVLTPPSPVGNERAEEGVLLKPPECGNIAMICCKAICIWF